MLGDVDNGNGLFLVIDLKLIILVDLSKYEIVFMFFVININGVINFFNIEFLFGSGVFLNVVGNDGEWG